MCPMRMLMRAAGLLALLAALCVAAMPSAAAEPVEQASELGVKAAYLYKFGDYIEWPAQAFADADSPLVIGVLGADALADELTGVVRGRRLGARAVQVRKLRPGDPLAGLHMLYIGDGEPVQRAEALQAIATQPTLTVTSAGADALPGSVITFVMVGERIRFDVNLVPADRQQLKISSLLLTVARRIES